MGYEKIYYDLNNANAFTGARNLLRAVENGRAEGPEKVYKWLSNEDAYTLHRPVVRRFPRLQYNVTNIDDVWELDLMVLPGLEKFNDGYNYVLTVIDVLSKYVWVEALKTKTALATGNAFEKILQRANGRVCVCAQSDKGKEFVGAGFQNVLKKHGIKFRTARNPDIKASVVERVIRTLKARLYRYFTYKNTKRYLDVLQKIAAGYNNTVHTGIGMKPVDVNFFNTLKARRHLYKRALAQSVNKRAKRARAPVLGYKVGQYVRISRTKGTFEPSYTRNFSEEIFVVERISQRQGLYTYVLKDLNGEEIDGFFYPQELTLVGAERVRPDQAFKIEKILTSRGKGARKEHLVKWLGYPASFNSWVRASEIKNI